MAVVFAGATAALALIPAASSAAAPPQPVRGTTSMAKPEGWRLTPAGALTAAERAAVVRRALRGRRDLTPVVRPLAGAPGNRQWVVSWMRGGARQIIAYVNDRAAQVTQVGTGAAAQLAAQVPLAAWNGAVPAPGQTLSPRAVIAIASRAAAVRRALHGHPGAVPTAWPTAVAHRWQLTWFNGTRAVVVAYFDPRSMRVTGVWTGRALAWSIGRGEPQYTGGHAGTWYVWIPLCLLFLAPFIDPRKPFRMLHVDLLALLSFAASTFFFDRGELSGSVPLIYPVLGYLVVRLLVMGLWPRRHEEHLVPFASEKLLLVGIVGLAAARIVLNVTGSIPLDVGYASSTGAAQLIHGHALYDGTLGRLVAGGDTYGPLTYLAYTPFALTLPGAHGMAYPAAHAAAIFYDLVTILGLVLLGRRCRPARQGRMLGLSLGYAWVAYPYTTFALMENTNDALVACTVVLTLLVLASPARRGVVLAVASLTKFVPLALVPLIATGAGPARRRTWLAFGAAFGIALLVLVLPFTGVSISGLHGFYRRTLAYQLGRTSPLSIWGQYPVLRPVQRLLEGATVLMACAFALRPRVRDVGQIAALSAATLVAIQLCANYWYYSYIVWFAPPALLAIFLQYQAPRRRTRVALRSLHPERAPAVAASQPVT